MSIFFSFDDVPYCKFCGQPLPGYSLSGHCPHCQRWYAVERASIAPGRLRAVALANRIRAARVVRASSTWTGLAAALLIVGNTTVVVLLGRMAIRSLYRACGMEW